MKSFSCAFVPVCPLAGCAKTAGERPEITAPSIAVAAATRRRRWRVLRNGVKNRRTQRQPAVAASFEHRHHAALLHSGVLTAEQKNPEKAIHGLTDIERDIGNNDDSPGDEGAST